MSLLKYSALSGKVHALYGKRLTDGDYLAMASMKTVPEIAEYLSRHPGWSDSLQSVTTRNIHRGALETALRAQYLDEYIRIFSFVARNDRHMMKYPIYKAELDSLMAVLRHLISRLPEPLQIKLPEIIVRQSKVDFNALAAAEDMESLKRAMAGSIYSPALEHISQTMKGELPEYTSTEILLNSTYFVRLQNDAAKYGGQTKKLLLRAVGEQIDLLNILHNLRLKRFFPKVDAQLFNFPYPFHYKLRPDFVKALINAPDYDAAFTLLNQSPYAKYFSQKTTAGLESYYYEQHYSFNKKQLRSGQPSIYTAIAYLELKEIELINLINIIESVRYGVDIRTSSISLIGVSLYTQ